MIKKYNNLEELKNDLNKGEKLYLYYNYTSDECEDGKVYGILKIDHSTKTKITVIAQPYKLNFIKCFDMIGAYCSIGIPDISKHTRTMDLTIKNGYIYGTYKYDWNGLIEKSKKIYKIITKDEIVRDCAMKY